ncbi:MAG: hypothetical protein GX767_04690 [Firmicutes bacterium]|nr:hypothetical protein [Bacillota bacterium]
MNCSLGQLVRSLAGRDKGKHYLVIGLTEERVLVADGRHRLVKKPKLKNRRHLQCYKRISKIIEQQLKQGQKLTDTVLRQELQYLLQEEASGKEDC